MKSFEEIFEKQIPDSKPLSKKMVDMMKGSPVYGKYEYGDKMFFFMEKNVDECAIKVSSITERTFDQFIKDFEFVEFYDKFPVMKRKK